MDTTLRIRLFMMYNFVVNPLEDLFTLTLKCTFLGLSSIRDIAHIFLQGFISRLRKRQSAFSATLKEALKQTFDNNLELQAERKNLEIQQEVINMSKSDLLPTLTLTGKKNFEETNEITTQAGADASVTDVNTGSASIKLEQTLLDGSGRKTEYEKSKLGLNLTEAKLIKKEQEIFLRAIEAYTGLILAYEKLNINEENVNLLQRQFELDNARLSRGQITASDLAQSQSSLAGAQARYIEAQNNIVTSKLNYENVIGAIAAKENLKKIYNAQVLIPRI